MKNNILKSLLVIGTVFVMTGCGGGSSPVSDVSMDLGDPLDGSAVEPLSADGEPSSGLPSEVQDAIDTPQSTLSQELKDSITYMYSEEGLAHDVYTNIYKIQAVKQLQNIATKSEVKHIDAVNQIAIKYDLNITQYPDTDVPYSKEGISSGVYPVEPIQELYTLLYDKGIQSKQDALEVGCMVEVVDIDDLDAYIVQAEASNAQDVLDVFNFLRNGSYTHYWAFDEGLRNMGISNGCCSVPDYDGHNFCHPEYPKK